MKVAFTGDVGFTRYFANQYAKNDIIDENVESFLKDTDYTVVNVEGAIFSGNASAKKALLHINPPEIVPFLKRINGKVWNVSNNHIYDAGDEGLLSTVEIAKENGAVALGVGETQEDASKPVILKGEDFGVGLLSVTDDLTPEATANSCGCVRFNNLKKIKKLIKEVKKTCKWCVINVHTGEEFAPIPMPYIRKIYRAYTKMGADIVIGHHPHVVENFEIIKGKSPKIIFYSLGNFIFDTDYQRKQDYTDVGVLVKVNFTKKDFAFEVTSIKIDREEHKIIAGGEIPAIFTNIDGKLYKKLWPLSAKVLRINERIKWAIIYPENKDFTPEEWEKWELERAKESPAERDILKGSVLSELNRWQDADEDLIKYIKGSRF